MLYDHSFTILSIQSTITNEVPSDDLMVSILTKQIRQLLDQITLKTILQITINFFNLILKVHLKYTIRQDLNIAITVMYCFLNEISINKYFFNLIIDLLSQCKFYFYFTFCY